MSKDYYKTLGVEKNASADEIKKAFHKMAHQYHPDKKTGDEAKFKEVNEAYQTLSDAKKRAQYDQFGSAGPQGGFGGGQGFGGFDFSGFQNQNGGMQFDMGDLDLGDIFSMFTGGQRVRRGRDYRMVIDLDFKDAVFGIKKTITLPHEMNGSKNVEVTIPAGIQHGEQLRLQGYGEPMKDGQPGNLYLEVRVRAHKTIFREGANLITRLEVKLSDALLGAEYNVETLDGKVSVKIPAGLQTGEILRLRDKGVPVRGRRGDFLIQTVIKIPKKLSKKEREAIEALRHEGN